MRSHNNSGRFRPRALCSQPGQAGMGHREALLPSHPRPAGDASPSQTASPHSLIQQISVKPPLWARHSSRFWENKGDKADKTPAQWSLHSGSNGMGEANRKLNTFYRVLEQRFLNSLRHKASSFFSNLHLDFWAISNAIDSEVCKGARVQTFLSAHAPVLHVWPLAAWVHNV